MIGGKFFVGSGVGDQLFRFVTSKIVAEEKGVEHGMVGRGNCKVSKFMTLPDYADMKGPYSEWSEKDIRDEKGLDIRSFDPEIHWVQDNTAIDGNFEDEKYWLHRLDDVREWFKVEPLNMPGNIVVIAHRGGEFTLYPELYLQKDYWDDAIAQFGPLYTYQVQTDDVKAARKLFPDYEIIHDVGYNWRAIRYAKNLILSNSAFGIFPALLNQDAQKIVAPRWWARRNLETWARPANYYSDKRFMYL